MNHEMSEAQKFVFIRTYARWIEEEGRRESDWNETAGRYIKFMHGRFGEKVPKTIWEAIENRVKTFGAMPSMRAAWSAGPALEEQNVCGYNCSYIPLDDLRSLAEMFYVLMCGTGVGFSVERENIEKMPTIQKWHGDGAGVFVVPDSKEGWADSLLAGLEAWFSGKDIEFDYSLVRPRGARLKKMGGRASGPAPLKKLHDFCRNMIMQAQGRKLTSLEWLDIGNMIADVVVVGGVRRSSQIVFCDIDDDLMRDAKNYSKGPIPAWRGMSNNSAVYHEKPDIITFLREWTALAESGSGERGIYNVSNLEKFAPRRTMVRNEAGRVTLRSNPCGEILLRPRQFCNLTEIVVRGNDTFDDLIEKAKAAVWMGVMQAALTDFPYLRPEFKKNCEEERLLGVSLTGQMDNPKLMTEDRLADLKQFVIKTARKASKAIGINMSVAITTGKPSGTVSQLVNCASGGHPRYSPFYIRRIRISATDPLFRMLREQGVEFSPENGQGPDDVEQRRKDLMDRGMSAGESKVLVPNWSADAVQTWVVSFPERSPKGAITRDQVSAIDQLEWYRKLQSCWCEHNQSTTIYVRDSEWLKVGTYVYDHFDEIVGVSFLPYDGGGNYKQMPYEEITEASYNKMVKAFPKIDYSQLGRYEMEDNTTGAQALACSAGGCELV